MMNSTERVESATLSDCLDQIGKMYNILLKEIQNSNSVCIYDFDKDLAEIYFVKRLKTHHNISTKYVNDGNYGYIQRLNIVEKIGEAINANIK